MENNIKIRTFDIHVNNNWNSNFTIDIYICIFNYLKDGNTNNQRHKNFRIDWF